MSIVYQTEEYSTWYTRILWWIANSRGVHKANAAFFLTKELFSDKAVMRRIGESHIDRFFKQEKYERVGNIHLQVEDPTGEGIVDQYRARVLAYGVPSEG